VDYKAHGTEEVQQAAAAHNIQLITVPKEQTSVVQPLDVSVNGETKARAKAQWMRDKQSSKENPRDAVQSVERVNEA
jgi:hypothetical protein